MNTLKKDYHHCEEFDEIMMDIISIDKDEGVFTTLLNNPHHNHDNPSTE